MIEKIDLEKCTGCGVCADVCPLDTLRIGPFQKEIPPCQAACPAMVDIRGHHYFLKNRRPWDALEILSEFLPFPAITGRLCHHPCEGKCARKGVDEPVNIHALERTVGDLMLTKGGERQPRLHAGKVAVIGSGPAGLAAAYFLIRMGYATTVFEKDETLGGSLRNDVRENRLPSNTLEGQLRYMGGMGVDFKTGIEVDRDHLTGLMEEDLYKRFCLAMGPASKVFEEMIRGEGKKDSSVPVVQRAKAPGIFLISGKGNAPIPIVKIVARVRETLLSIERFMKGQAPPPDERKERIRVKRLPGKGMAVMERLGPGKDPSASFSREQTLGEAQRCMTCGARAFVAHPEDCMTCFNCDLGCPSGAVTVHPFKEVITSPIQYSAGGDDLV